MQKLPATNVHVKQENQWWYVEDLIAGLDASATKKYLLTRVHRRQNTKTGLAWASQKTVAREMCVALSTVKRAFRWAKKIGVIGVRRIRTGKGMDDQYNEYWLDIPRLKELQPEQGSPVTPATSRSRGQIEQEQGSNSTSSRGQIQPQARVTSDPQRLEVKQGESTSRKEKARGSPVGSHDPSAQLYTDKLKRLAGDLTEQLVQRMNGLDSWKPTFFGDIRSNFKERADDAAIDFKDACNIYRGAMRCAEWIVTPLEPVAENPIGPINQQRLQELIAEDQTCLGGYMQPDGSAWMEFKDGTMYIPPDGVEPVWHPFDDPVEKSEI